jgi:hypothetical protein
MSQIVRIQNQFLHIPSISRVRLTQTPFLGRPLLVVQTHSGEVGEIRYKRKLWDEAILDYKKVYRSLTACQEVLKRLPWMEESVEAYNPLVESERRLS